MHSPATCRTVVLGSSWSVNVEARKGQPYGVLFGSPYLRDSTGALLLHNGLPQADVANRRVLGNYNPNWTGGWSNEFQFRNVGFSFLFDIKNGGQIFSSGNMFATYSGVLASTLTGREVDWDNPGIIVKGNDDKTGTANTTNVTSEEYYQSLYGIHEAFVSDAGFHQVARSALVIRLLTAHGQSGAHEVGQRFTHWPQLVDAYEVSEFRSGKCLQLWATCRALILPRLRPRSRSASTSPSRRE